MYNPVENSLRIVVFLLGLFGALLISKWVAIVCIGLLALRFRAWEAIVLGVIVDLMWLPAGSLFGHLPLYTLGSIAVVWALEPLRSEFLLN
jgi:hypothetical protein